MDDMAPGDDPLPSTDEAELLPLLRAGDAAASESLVRRFGPRMLAAARRVLRNDEDAREALQDAFLLAFRAIGRFEGRSGLGTWLHRIAVNASLMKLRRRQQTECSIEAFLPHFGEGEHQLDSPVPWKDAAADPLERQELLALVRSGIDQLPETYRVVLLMRDLEGLDTAETARLLQTSIAVVKTRLHRARQALRTILDPHLRRDNV